MSRTASTTRWIALGVVLTLCLGFAWLVLSPANADAQPSGDATITLAASEATAGQPFRTVGVAIDPGTHGLAALGASLAFDAEAVSVTACEVSEAGACNVTDDGHVHVSVFNLSGLKSNEQLVTVNFEPITSGTTQFTLEVTTAVNFNGTALPEIDVTPLDVVMAETQYGSLTGDVVATDSETALFGLAVCATNNESFEQSCTTTSGLGTWRLDELPAGNHTVAVTDPTGVYASAEFAALVVGDQVTTAADTSLGFATDEDAASTDAPTQTDPPANQLPQSPAAEIIVYEASIAGRVTAIDTRQPLEAMQVCATQPFVLHQSCATTDVDGMFVLAGLSTGNYWVTVVDPLARYQESAPKLVGVVSDQVTRGGVRILLTPVAE